MAERATEVAVGRCPVCLRARLGNPDPTFGLSFAPPCDHCGTARIPEPFESKLYVWICPHCMKQYPGPSGHHVLGDDSANGCFHRHPGERGVSQPRLVRVEVQPVAAFEPHEIPHDRPPRVAHA